MKGRLRSNPSNRPVGASAGGCISLQGVRLSAHRENAHIPPLSEISKRLRGSALVAPQTQEIFFPESRTFGFLLSFGAAKGLLHGAISSTRMVAQHIRFTTLGQNPSAICHAVSTTAEMSLTWPAS